MQKILEQVGLNDREVKVYLATLELGESTVLPIAKKADIKRTYCYDILSDLQKKGLVSFYEKNNRRRYVAENPSKIADILKGRLDDFRAILPDLRSIYNHSPQKPRVRYFEGIEGILSLYDEVIKDKPKALDAISSPAHIEEFIGEHFFDYLTKLTTINTFSRDIVAFSAQKSRFVSWLNQNNFQYKIMPQDSAIATDIMIYDNKFIQISYTQEIHAVVIESTGIADTQKALFEIIWNSCK